MSLEQLVEYIKKDSDARFAEIKTELKDMSKKMDTLLQFKWQIIGGSLAINAILTVIVQVLIFIFKP